MKVFAASSPLLGVGGYLVKQKFDAKARDLAACAAERDAHKAKVDEQLHQAERVGQERDDEKASRADTEKALAEMQANLSATRSELDELRQEHTEAEHRMAAVKLLTAKLQKMIDTGKLKVLVRGGRMVVKLPAEILFASGKAELSPSGRSRAPRTRAGAQVAS